MIHLTAVFEMNVFEMNDIRAYNVFILRKKKKNNLNIFTPP
jgi:hypothetical protein